MERTCLSFACASNDMICVVYTLHKAKVIFVELKISIFVKFMLKYLRDDKIVERGDLSSFEKFSRRFWTRPANLQIRIYWVCQQLLFLKEKPLILHQDLYWWQKSREIVCLIHFWKNLFTLISVSYGLNSFWCLATFARPYVENTFGHMLKIWGFHKVFSSSHQHSGLKLWFTIKISRRKN